MSGTPLALGCTGIEALGAPTGGGAGTTTGGGKGASAGEDCGGSAPTGARSCGADASAPGG